MIYFVAFIVTGTLQNIRLMDCCCCCRLHVVSSLFVAKKKRYRSKGRIFQGQRSTTTASVTRPAYFMVYQVHVTTVVFLSLDQSKSQCVSKVYPVARYGMVRARDGWIRRLDADGYKVNRKIILRRQARTPFHRYAVTPSLLPACSLLAVARMWI